MLNYAILRRIGKDKHFGLMRQFVICEENEVLKIQPW